MWKKLVLAAMVATSFSIVMPIAAETIPASQVADASPLYGKYPCIGGNDASMFYLDPSSCIATTDGNVATLSAMFYGTGGGAAPWGGPAKLTPYTVTFKTYKKNHSRIIILDTISTRGRDITQYMKKDKAFTNELFWTIADYTGMKPYLD